MIRFEHVFKSYKNGGDALRNINFHMEKGELAFLTGHSGAGKSTLLDLICQRQHCSRGRVIIDRQHLKPGYSRQMCLMRRRMGIVSQDPRLLPGSSVLDNVLLPWLVQGYSRDEVKKQARAALDKVGLLHKAFHRPNTLSGGEKQRVSIARAIVHRPALVIADEPTGNLDPELAKSIMDVLIGLRHTGCTVLIATHHLSLIAHLPHRIITLMKGEIISHGD